MVLFETEIQKHGKGILVNRSSMLPAVVILFRSFKYTSLLQELMHLSEYLPLSRFISSKKMIPLNLTEMTQKLTD